MITKKQVKQIGFNSRIALSEEEMEAFTQKLNETIEMVSTINDLDLIEVEPMFYPNERIADFRNPELEMPANRDGLLANTVETEDGYFKLPAVLKDGES